MRAALFVAGETDHVEQLADAAAGASRHDGVSVDAVGDVAGDAEMREQRAVLRHDADAPPLWRHVRTGPADRPAGELDGAGVEALEPGDGAQQRRLAGARLAEHDGQRPVRHGQLDVVERHHRRPPGERLRRLAHLDRATCAPGRHRATADRRP